MPSERYKKIIEENRRFERESPYNFCDRWCERCTHEKQIRCKLYQDEFEQRITCIAHGRDERDPEITTKVMEAQFKETEDKLAKYAEEHTEIFEEDELEEVDFQDLPPEIQKHIKFSENHPLPATADQWCKRAHEFLQDTYYGKQGMPAERAYHFETVAWYHTLLGPKLERALAGFHEPVCEGEFALYDAVAQFAICKKAIDESLKALRILKPYYPEHKNRITELIALLHNIGSRIEALVDSV